MARRIRLVTSYSNVTATLALFVALSGGAYAATALPKNSVGAAQLKKNAVERSKLKKNAVNGSKVAANTLTGANIKESSLGAVPSAAALETVTYKTAAGTAPSRAFAGATATCNAGQKAVGGGARVDDPNNAFIIDSYPDAANTAWTSRVANAAGGPVNFTAFAVCVRIAG